MAQASLRVRLWASRADLSFALRTGPGIDFLRIKRANLPGVVVIDPPMSEYYDTTIEGSKISFDGASIFSVLEGFYQHFLRPKRSETALEWGSRSATMTLITTGVSPRCTQLWAVRLCANVMCSNG